MDASRAILLWAWDAAPAELRALSTHGGDEDFVAFVPNGVDDSYVRDALFQHYAHVSEAAHDGGTLLIAAH